MALHTFGTMGVDWEERVRFDRLREERLARIKAQLAASDMGALLCFDMTNIRYITATHIGTWAQDKLNRFCLLPQRDEPIMWDFGSAARHHAAVLPVARRGALARGHLARCAARCRPSRAAPRDVAAQDPRRARGARPARTSRSASTRSSPPVLFALQAEGIEIVDGQQLMQQARVIKTRGRDHAARTRPA